MSHHRCFFKPIESLDHDDILAALTRRRFLIGAGAFALSACGAPTASLPTATVPTTRRVSHIRGDSEVPLHPQRIIAFNLAGSLLALNIVPIGVIEFEHDQLAFTQKLNGVASIGSATEGGYNLETVSGLKPDLILVVDGDELSQYDLFKAIAPTVVVTDPQIDFRQTVRDIGAALGIEATVSARITAFDQFVATARAEVARLIGDDMVALVNVRADHYRLYGIKQGYSGPILYGELGMRPAALVQELVPEDANARISLEVLSRLDAERIFLLTTSDVQEQTTLLQSQALWQGLPAVQAGHVYPVNDMYWYSANMITQEYKIRDVVAALGGTLPA